MLTTLSIHDFINKMSTDPPPGGGSAAALNGLIGVSLLEMAVTVSANQPEGEQNAGEFSESLKTLRRLHIALEQLIDQDALVLQEVLPILSSAAMRENNDQYAFAVRRAIEAPLAIAGACLETLAAGLSVLDKAAGHVVADMGTGALTSYAGCCGALLLVAMNVELLSDQPLVQDYRHRMTGLQQQADRLIGEIRKKIHSQDVYSVLRA